jgi:hypothetical protein
MSHAQCARKQGTYLRILRQLYTSGCLLMPAYASSQALPEAWEGVCVGAMCVK